MSQYPAEADSAFGKRLRCWSFYNLLHSYHELIQSEQHPGRHAKSRRFFRRRRFAVESEMQRRLGDQWKYRVEAIDRYPVEVERSGGTMEELAEELGDLRYDYLAWFLRQLSTKLSTDAIHCDEHGRQRLALALHRSACAMQEAAGATQEAWHICAPYIDPEVKG